MKKIFKIFIPIIIALIILIIPVNTHADVGSFESYDSGSWDSDWDWDYDGGSYYGGFSFGGFGGIASIIIFIVIAYLTSKARGKARPINTQSVNIPQFYNEQAVEAQVKAIDELFNKEEFIAWSKTLFVKLQEAWMARDWSTIRYFETNELFEQHQKQLQGYIDNHQINMLERICVKSASLSEFKQIGDKDVLTVVLNSKMIDYIINDETKKIEVGDKTTERHSTYKLVFVRKTGVKTKPGMDTVNTTNCPNCGAPTKITSSGQCEYCGSVITTGEYNWVLSNLEKIG